MNSVLDGHSRMELIMGLSCFLIGCLEGPALVVLRDAHRPLQSHGMKPVYIITIHKYVYSYLLHTITTFVFTVKANMHNNYHSPFQALRMKTGTTDNHEEML